jgi:hypothetical protein
MAKVSVSIELDTEEGTMVVSVNGKKVPSANYVCAYTSHNMYENKDEINCHITAMEADEESGINKQTTYYTSQSSEAKKISKVDAVINPNLPDFVGQIKVDPTPAMTEFFESKSRFR